jgi:hypothetical protein
MAYNADPRPAEQERFTLLVSAVAVPRCNTHPVKIRHGKRLRRRAGVFLARIASPSVIPGRIVVGIRIIFITTSPADLVVG